MKLTAHEVRSLAVAAMVDPRSVRKAVAGQPLAHLTLQRIRAAAVQMGGAELLSALAANGNTVEPPPAAA